MKLGNCRILVYNTACQMILLQALW